MEPFDAIDWIRQALGLLLVVSLPLLATALVVGLTTALLQAVTQVSDPTLSFVPKILAVLLVAVVTLPWIVSMLVDFAKNMFALP